MPSVESNTLFRCERCDARIDRQSRPFRCPGCGHNRFVQIAVVVCCDFCSENVDAGWTYPCADFDYGIANFPGDGSLGEWAACDRCHELIDQGRKTTLFRRAVELELRRHPNLVPRKSAVGALIAKIHAGFHQHRCEGPVRRETQTEHDRKEDR